MPGSQQQRREFWRELIAQQQQGGGPVRGFCQQRRISEPSFYHWRKRLAGQFPMKFALVETGRNAPDLSGPACVEVILASGERLRIASGADASTVRTVLGILREPR